MFGVSVIQQMWNFNQQFGGFLLYNRQIHKSFLFIQQRKPNDKPTQMRISSAGSIENFSLG
ncbi:MAG: hypothetical protein BGO78_02555 [Chloroflexi bacterium 44-23]|nr:MAG: hypothetical protein BGO78_02555 [Chloroflexi bacterium 44-23]